MRPNRLIVRAYLSRGAQLWLATRAMLSAAFVLAGLDPLRLSTAAAVETILISIVMSFLETRRRKERAFLANLGVGPLVLGALFAGPALVGEVALRIGGTVFQ